MKKNILLFLIFLGSIACYAKDAKRKPVKAKVEKTSKTKSDRNHSTLQSDVIVTDTLSRKKALKTKKNSNIKSDVVQTDIISTSRVKSPKPKRVLVDKMVGIVHGSERSQIFCLSDQNRRGIDGRARSLQDSIAEELIYQDAIRFKIPIDDNVVKEHLNRTMQTFGLKPGEEITIFAQEGYSYQEGFEKFRLMYANNVMMDYRIKQNMLITEQEVISFYNSNPIEKEPKYQLQTTFVSVDKQKGQKSRGIEMDIDKFIQTGKGIDITWSDPYWVVENDLAEGLDFISSMSTGEIRKQKVVDGFQLYEMKKKKPKRKVSLKKRYKDIVDTLRQPKFEVTFQKYRKSLFDSATIIHL